MKKITEKVNKVEAFLIRNFYYIFIKFIEKKIINKIKLQLTLRLIKIETAPKPYFNELDERKRLEIIGGEWFKHNQWMRNPTFK